jgi:hypothetical protein
VRRGAVLCADDPVVKRAPGLFEPYALLHHCAAGNAPVERATAAPGELRDVQLPRSDEEKPRRGPGRPRKQAEPEE